MSAIAGTNRVDRAWKVLDEVPDPEVPAISISDLGIVRGVIDRGEVLEIVLTPTYSGCPATEVIERSVVDAICAAGLGPVQVSLQRAPAWTTSWISERGRQRLKECGIAPPSTREISIVRPLRFMGRQSKVDSPACPQCGSANTEMLSNFGSTACKALWRCVSCREPFEYFKPI
jgi:ring-1,2-phenylacetyl-CoA epoxidase subunit PaaD